MKTFLLSFSIILQSLISSVYSSYPVAIFHGIGDSCNTRRADRFEAYFWDNLDGAYTKCIETGGGSEDWVTSFRSQAEKACETIRNDPNFDEDFSIVGMSQGGLLARYIIQSCEMKGRVKRFISIGGPQMGVGKVPKCDSGIFCTIVNKLVKTAIYSSYVQNYIGPAGYFKDIRNYNTYLEASSFLADINNERPVKNQEYKNRFLMLEKVVLIKFSEDTVIIPRETAWFEFYDNNKKVVDLKDSEFYKNDFIGVRKLYEQAKISFVQLSGNHLSFNYDDLDEFVLPALR